VYRAKNAMDCLFRYVGRLASHSRRVQLPLRFVHHTSGCRHESDRPTLITRPDLKRGEAPTGWRKISGEREERSAIVCILNNVGQPFIRIFRTDAQDCEEVTCDINGGRPAYAEKIPLSWFLNGNRKLIAPGRGLKEPRREFQWLHGSG